MGVVPGAELAFAPGITQGDNGIALLPEAFGGSPPGEARTRSEEFLI
jgi:hypothetical protein